MRTGANPAKSGLPAYTPQKLGIALIVYVPFTEGYFEHSLEIFKIQLSSIRAATPVPFDLLVFDNGSCPQVIAELQSLYSQKSSDNPNRIDWLVLSRHNLGKAGAWNWIFAAMPNELICYADSDVLFRPGWLEASLEILAAFPQAGMVSAQPNFYDVMQGAGKAHESATAQYSLSEYWPGREIIDEYCLGIGASDDLAAQFYQKPLPAITRLEDKESQIAQNVQAVIGASHMQFIIPGKVARLAVPLPATKALLRTETMALDFKVDQLGYLHLSTLEPFVFHMGNTLNATLLEKVHSVIAAGDPATGQSASRSKSQMGNESMGLKKWLVKLARRPRFKAYFIKLYNLLFQVLNSEKNQ